MVWDPVWERVFSTQNWGKYPGEDLIRFVARNFYGAADRATIRILEVGSGTGANLWFFAREGFSAHGIEGSPTAAALAQERLERECPGWNEQPLSGTVRVGDMLSLPWPDEYFDAVVDCEAVYCNDFGESCTIYGEMQRVTRSEGKLFVRTFAPGTWGDGTGEQLGLHRFVAAAGPLAGKGPSRFTEESELEVLLASWQLTDVNLITRSLDSRRHVIREWIVEGCKS